MEKNTIIKMSIPESAIFIRLDKGTLILIQLLLIRLALLDYINCIGRLY